MLPTQELIDQLAERIERAYALRRQSWCRGCTTRRVWSAAALRLWQAHVDDPQVPLDCELYVASQEINESLSDPWSELTQPASARRYRVRIRRIVAGLRRELSKELQRAASLIRKQGKIGLIAPPSGRRISPLGYYIAAHRAGMPELAGRFADAAAEQHRSCPLYRFASLAFLPADLYPSGKDILEPAPDPALRSVKKLIVMN